MRNISSRTISFIDITRNALVLGSSQGQNDFELSALSEFNAELVKRKSGGGAVYLYKQGQVWIDISIPKSDPMYRTDVSSSFEPIGEIFLEILKGWIGSDLAIHKGKLLGGEIGRLICFAGIGPGEVTFEGSKLVGISQRRTALGSVFQCTMYLRYPYLELSRLTNGLVMQQPKSGYAVGICEIVPEFFGIQFFETLSKIKERVIEVIMYH